MAYYFQENSWGERYLPEINRRIFEQAPSTDYFSTHLDFNPAAEDTFHVFIGTDSGLLIDYIRSVELGAGSKVLFIELDDLVALVGRSVDALACGEGASATPLCSASQWRQRLLAQSDAAWFISRDIRLIQSHGCERDYVQTYQALYRAVKEGIEEHRIDLLQRHGRRTFMELQMHNAADNILPFPVSAEFGRGKVAVVLGGGPSLDEHIEWISRYRDRVFLIAVSRLCQRLEELVLLPDVVVSIDPQPGMYDVSRQGTLWKGIPLIHSYHLAPQLLQQWRGPHYYVGERLPWHGCGGHSTATLSSTGESVSHTAVLVAAQLGFSTILMAGVDFCYSVAGHSHFAGTPEAELLKLPSRYEVQVTTYGGREAGTSRVLHRTIDNMMQIGRLINAQRARLFNISLDAAAIPGIAFLDRQTLQLPEARPEWHHHRAIDLSQLDALRHELDEAVSCLRQLAELSASARALLANTQLEGAIESEVNAVLELERQQSLHREYTQAIGFYMALELASLMPEGGAPVVPSTLERESRLEYHRIMGEGAACLLRLIDVTREKLITRELELQPDPDLTALAARWVDEGTPGRALRFLDAREEELSREQLSPIRLLAETHEQSVNAAAPACAAQPEQDANNLERAVQSVVFLYNNAALGDLVSLSRNITDQHWQSIAMVSFIRAMVADLQRNVVLAERHYQSVVDQCSDQLGEHSADQSGILSLVEETLSRMTQLYLTDNNTQAAMETLSTLCELDARYICAYAELLNTLGQAQPAIELLTLYLESRPEHWQAAVQLSELHAQVGDAALAERVMRQAREARDSGFGQEHKAA